MATILLVDDDPLKRNLLRGLLAHRGYTLLEAEDGQRGLDLAKQEHPDLIIADLIMPNMNGHEFCSRLRQDPDLAQIPLAVCSGMHPEDIQVIAKDCDVRHIIPYTPGLGMHLDRVLNEAVMHKVIDEALSGSGLPQAEARGEEFEAELEDVLARLKALSAKLPL